MTFITHCLIYYLSGQMPLIRIFDADNNTGEVINDLFEQVSQEKERTFQVGTHTFRAYITKVLKENNRKNHYIYYCANSRVVGQPKSIGRVGFNNEEVAYEMHNLWLLDERFLAYKFIALPSNLTTHLRYKLTKK